MAIPISVADFANEDDLFVLSVPVYTMRKMACLWAIESLNILSNKSELTCHVTHECFLDCVH